MDRLALLVRKRALTLLLLPLTLGAQDLQTALTGSWVGTLEYRDFSEPATSTRRVKLPTWLTVAASGTGLRFSYVYDDGPGKTVTEVETVRIDSAKSVYTIAGEKSEIAYAVSGLQQLKAGRGTLILTGPGTENGAPVQTRTTIKIGRNIIEILRETGPAGGPFAFRHAYTFVRLEPQK